jgi:hypothetical protein
MNRAQVARARQRRRRVVLSLAFLLAFGMLVGVGVGVGAAVGVAAARARESDVLARFLPGGEPSLPAAKALPPAPADISGPAVACAASSLAINLLTDRASIDPGEGIGLHITVTNIGRYPCLVNGGLENLRVRLVDANGVTVWNTADCGFTGKRQLLMGSGYQTTWDIGWDGHMSASERCTEGQPVVSPGNWQFIASLAEVAHSDSDPVTILVRGAEVPVTQPEPVPEPEPEPEPVIDSMPDEEPVVSDETSTGVIESTD